MMINNTGDVSFALAQRENTSFTTCKACTIDMCVIFHINDTLNDSYKFFMQVYERSYNACVPNYTRIYSSYSAVTSCQGSGLACTRDCFYF